MIEKIDPDDNEQFEKIRQTIHPQIDGSIRNAIRMAWMVLPKERKTIDEAEKQIRRMVDRAFQDMRDDRENFFGKDVAE